MATLILTAVGTAVGGPVGGMIGGLLGQAVDRDILFKPKGRQGPRLTELAVQTSSYGTPIQKLFGAIRVAGTVIWSTDLIESRSTSGHGKGQPSTTTYSYAASFAVALSGRPIKGVARIWADGNLLRGASGDFKTETGFRLHTGGEDQPADPLIASAEGIAVTPAHRGIAYAVFENFQLADYGNRIPSLTFEVIADDAPVTAGGIAAELAGGDIDGAGVTLAVPGFAAYGDSVRAVAETLATASGAWFAPAGGGVRMLAGSPPAVRIDDAGMAAGRSVGATGTRSIAAIETVPREIGIAYYDPARDYQTGMQRARRPGAGSRQERIDMPAVLDAGAVKAMGAAALASREAARERRTVALGWDRLAIAPGACVTIAGAGGVWRVTGWTLERMALTLDCVRIAASSPAAAAAGRVLSAPDLVAGPTILHAFETPALDDSLLSAPRLTIAAAGSSAGWRRAALLYSTDNGAHWIAAGPTAAPATMGTLVRPPVPGAALLIDMRGSVEVALAHAGMVLVNADAQALDGGANLALVGDELIQFGRAEPIGPARWRLTRLLRGRRGTEAAAGRQVVGDRFVLIEPDAAVAIDLPIAMLGAPVRVLASGVGDIAGPVLAAATITGASVLPPSPAHLRVEIAPGGDATVRWVRRSRAGWRWTDGVDAPLAEERELYRVTVTSGSGATRRIDVIAPEIILPAADRIGGAATVAVTQAGSHGESVAAICTLPELEART